MGREADYYVKLFQDEAASEPQNARVFEELCQNSDVSDEVLERLVGRRLGDSATALPKELLRVLASYVQYRQPGPWFWEWWDRYVMWQQEWDYSVEWEVVDIYTRKAGVAEADIIAMIDRNQLWRVSWIYLQNWASVKVCRRWLQGAADLVDERTDINGKLHARVSYDWQILVEIYKQDHDKALAIINSQVLARMMIESVGGEVERMATDILVGADEKVVLRAMELAQAYVWERPFAGVFTKTFALLRPKVKACLLDLAPMNIKKDLIGKIGGRR